MARSKIEWLARPGTIPESWSPVTGCTPISEGCAHCYAERMAKRLAGRYGYPEQPYHFDVTLHPDRLDTPLKWKKPRTVFVCSMGDLFHMAVPFEFIRDVFTVMCEAERHTFLLLTKRPGNALICWGAKMPWNHNIWLGVTCENQARADERIPLLLQCPAAVRFVSIEPMLGPVDLSNWLSLIQYQTGWELSTATGPGLDWVIVGGESGPGARPMRPDWVRGVRDQCQSASVPLFFKQMSKREPIPDDLMIREFPDA